MKTGRRRKLRSGEPLSEKKQIMNMTNCSPYCLHADFRGHGAGRANEDSSDSSEQRSFSLIKECSVSPVSVTEPFYPVHWA